MFTHTFTVSSAAPVPIQVPGSEAIKYRKIVIAEDGTPTVGFKILAPFNSSTPVSYEVGAEFVCDRTLRPAGYFGGLIIGYIRTLSGTTTFRMVGE